MPKALILFATREGQTRKVSKRINMRLAKSGADVQMVDAADSGAAGDVDVDMFDLLIFGASMHAGGLESEIVDFINRHSAQISAKNRTFFLVLLSAATKEKDLREKWISDARRKLNEQLIVRFDEIEMVAGALAYSKYSIPVRWVMKRIAEKAGEATDTSKDYEYTDWDQVDRYAARLSANLSALGPG